jgi:hypothetical protein
MTISGTKGKGAGIALRKLFNALTTCIHCVVITIVLSIGVVVLLTALVMIIRIVQVL